MLNSVGCWTWPETSAGAAPLTRRCRAGCVFSSPLTVFGDGRAALKAEGRGAHLT